MRACLSQLHVTGNRQQLRQPYMQKCASVYYKSEQHYSNGALAATRHCDLVASGGCGAHREETMDTADQNQFELNEDQLAIQDMARGFASDFVAPHALRWDRDKHFPIDVIKGNRTAWHGWHLCSRRRRWIGT